MPYRPPSLDEIDQTWMGALVGTSEVDDVSSAGAVRSLVRNGSKLIDKVHQRIEAGRRGFFGDEEGADLDEICGLLPGFRPRLGPSKANGLTMQFVRNTTVGAQAVSSGIVVASADDDTVLWVTTEGFTWEDGEDTYPTDGGTGVNIICLSAGEIGNIASGAIDTLVSGYPPEMISCINLSPLTNGLARETDARLRQRRQDYIVGTQGGSLSFFDYLAKSFVYTPTDGFAQHVKSRTSRTIQGMVEIMVDDGDGYASAVASAQTVAGTVPDNGLRIIPFHGPAATNPVIVHDGTTYLLSHDDIKASLVVRHEDGQAIVLPDATLFTTPGVAYSLGGHQVYGGLPAALQAKINGVMSAALETPGYGMAGLRYRVFVPTTELVAFSLRVTVHRDEDFDVVFRRVRDAIVRFLRGLPPGETLYLFDLNDALHDVQGVKNIRILSPTDDVSPGYDARLGTKGALINLVAG